METNAPGPLTPGQDRSEATCAVPTGLQQERASGAHSFITCLPFPASLLPPRPPAQFLWDHLLKHPAGGCFWRNPNQDNPSFVDCPEAHVRSSLNNFPVNDHETSVVVLESGIQ